MKPKPINKAQWRFMQDAGFCADFEFGTDVNLIYWKRGDITIMLFRNDKITLSNFTDLLIRASVHTARRAFSNRITNALSYDKDVKNLFKITNE